MSLGLLWLLSLLKYNKSKDINCGVHHIIWRIHNLLILNFEFSLLISKKALSVLQPNIFITLLLTTKFDEFTISEFPKNHWLWNSWNHMKNLKFKCHLFQNRECKIKLSKYLIQWIFDLRKFLGTAKNFLKSKIFLKSNTPSSLKYANQNYYIYFYDPIH